MSNNSRGCRGFYVGARRAVPESNRSGLINQAPTVGLAALYALC